MRFIDCDEDMPVVRIELSRTEALALANVHGAMSVSEIREKLVKHSRDYDDDKAMEKAVSSLGEFYGELRARFPRTRRWQE